MMNSSNMIAGATMAALPGSATESKAPALAWQMVLVLSICTFGLFGVYWLYRQGLYARQLNPKVKPHLMVIAAAAVGVFSVFASLIEVWTVMRGGTAEPGNTFQLMNLWGAFFSVAAILMIRKTLLDHYNRLRPGSLRLNFLLSLFFHAVYFQYHLNRLEKAEAARA